MHTENMTYSSYLQLEPLLSLQSGVNATTNNNELLFVTIHQVCELWFKLLLATFEKIISHLNADQIHEACSATHRCRTIIKTLVGQMDIIGTLTPVAFNQYRSMLGGSSGLQSCQFREIEFLLGYRRQQIIEFFAENSWERKKLESRMQQQSLNDALLDLITRHSSEVANPGGEITTLQARAATLYRNNPAIAGLFELLLDVDEGMQEWRYRHVKLVERVIGTKTGTGGTPGLEFLKATLFKPFFSLLWEIRAC